MLSSLQYNGALALAAATKRLSHSSRPVSSVLWAQGTSELPESEYPWTSFSITSFGSPTHQHALVFTSEVVGLVLHCRVVQYRQLAVDLGKLRRLRSTSEIALTEHVGLQLSTLSTHVQSSAQNRGRDFPAYSWSSHRRSLGKRHTLSWVKRMTRCQRGCLASAPRSSNTGSLVRF